MLWSYLKPIDPIINSVCRCFNKNCLSVTVEWNGNTPVAKLGVDKHWLKGEDGTKIVLCAMCMTSFKEKK